MGTVRVEFEFHMTAPVQDRIYVRFADGDQIPFIDLVTGGLLAKALCKHHGVEDQGIRLLLLPECADRIVSRVAEVAAAYRIAQEQIEVTGWHWALGGDSHRVLIFPDQEKDTEEIDQIRAFARSTFQFDDRIRPVSREIDLDVRGLYTTGGWYAISHEDLMQVIREIQAEQESARQDRERKRQEKYAAALATALETQQPAVLSSRMVPCNDPDEECDLDHETIYVRPDGTTFTRRHHTW